MTSYPLLSATDVQNVRDKLGGRHAYFYHGTLERHLPSIVQHGLDPRFESDDSSYARRNREPEKAIRYCTDAAVGLACSAAVTRGQIWEEGTGLWVPGPSRPVLLRLKAASLLSRSFGLDHSFGNLSAAAEAMFSPSKAQLTPDEFLSLVEKFGALSCYEVIPPDELELSLELRVQSAFVPIV